MSKADGSVTDPRVADAGKTFDPVIYRGAGHGFMRTGKQPDAPASLQSVEPRPRYALCVVRVHHLDARTASAQSACFVEVGTADGVEWEPIAHRMGREPP